MFPESYQKTLRGHLNERQYITIQLLLLLLQVHRQVKLSPNEFGGVVNLNYLSYSRNTVVNYK
ncbi:MAG TPA: hypothetical protein DEF48_05875 [Nostoc sp. UBA8866]|nr:hypothetical protein [Nostoc sp. UBA8866]